MRRLTRLLGVVGVLMVFGSTPLAGLQPAGATTHAKLPFTDPQADGYIGLCDLAGHNVTSGSINTTPFVWKAVSSARPPAAYSGPGQTASLAIYQARPGIPPSDWSGNFLTSSTEYKYPAIPTVAATYEDTPISEQMQMLPPKLDGLYALRMIFGKANYGVYSQTYPMTVIQVANGRWHVVSGGLVDCAKATGISQEVLTHVAAAVQDPKHPADATPAVAPSADRPTSTAVPSADPSAKATSKAALTQTQSDPITEQVSGLAKSGGGLSAPAIALIVVVVLLVAALGWIAVTRRRNPGGSTPA